VQFKSGETRRNAYLAVPEAGSVEMSLAIHAARMPGTATVVSLLARRLWWVDMKIPRPQMRHRKHHVRGGKVPPIEEECHPPATAWHIFQIASVRLGAQWLVFPLIHFVKNIERGLAALPLRGGSNIDGVVGENWCSGHLRFGGIHGVFFFFFS
jgi:hypothetical protein